MGDVREMDTAIFRMAASVNFDPFTMAPAREGSTTSRPYGCQKPIVSCMMMAFTALLTFPTSIPTIIPITIARYMRRDMACK